MSDRIYRILLRLGWACSPSAAVTGHCRCRWCGRMRKERR